MLLNLNSGFNAVVLVATISPEPDVKLISPVPPVIKDKS